MNTLQKICLSITIIGAINWGLIGLLDFNLVEALFGAESIVPRIIYSLVGLCGLNKYWNTCNALRGRLKK